MKLHHSLLSHTRSAGLLLAATALSVASAKAAVATYSPSDYALVTNSSSNSTDAYKSNTGGTLIGASIHGGYAYGEATLLRFDLSSAAIPVGATITKVTLTLTSAYSYSYGGFTETLHFAQVAVANAAWDGTSTDNRKGVTGAYLNQTSYTSTTVHGGTRWASNTLFGRAGDLGTEVGSQTFESIAANTTYTFTLSTSLVESWLSNPTAAQAGLAVYSTNNEATAAASRFMYFYSGNASVSNAFKPILTIEYETIPEPKTVVALALGGIVLAVRRWRRAWA